MFFFYLNYHDLQLKEKTATFDIVSKSMGCLKLSNIEENNTVLRCVWNAWEQSKNRVKWYDYGARFYDPQIGRWTTPDPMTELHLDFTQYNYCFNNPMNFIDPVGLDTLPVINDNNEGLKELPEVTCTASRSDNSSQSNDNSYNGELIAMLAKSDEKKYIRGSKVSEIRPVNFNHVIGITKFDCTGYLAYQLSSNYPELVKALNIGPAYNVISYANSYGGIRKINPKPGYFVIWTGHVEIVTSTNGQCFETMGSSGKDNSPVPTSKSFSGLDDPKLSWRSGTFLGVWTPQLPQPVVNNK